MENLNKTMDKKMDPVIEAQAKALAEQCRSKGYAGIIALANAKDARPFTFQVFGTAKPLMVCVCTTIVGVYDALEDKKLQGIYYMALKKAMKMLPGLAILAHYCRVVKKA
ncbi:hypothetical protein [Acidaminococcus sp.]|uniref:hypothetical protein n=1 Tax=Acidaminococcus sp. TaxID=1872103 RepID=UPI003D7E61BC